jgi:TRAP-type C4-dicarboxylate transport system permease small subunit
MPKIGLLSALLTWKWSIQLAVILVFFFIYRRFKKQSVAFLDKFEKFLTNLTAVLMIILSLLICWQVFGRYVLQNSPFWIEEIAVIGLMWVGLIGATGGVWTDTHMSLTVVTSRLPQTVQAWLKALTYIIVGLFSWLMLEQGADLVNKTMSGTMATLPIALGLTYLILPIAGGITVIFAFFKAFITINQLYILKGAKTNA